MSSSPYPSGSDPNFDQPAGVPTNAVTYAEIDRTIQDIRIDNTRLERDVQQLRGRTAALIGLLIGLIFLMIGGGIWLASELQNKEKQQTSSGIDPVFSERVEKLEQQVNDLTKTVPGNLTDTLQSNQTALSQLRTEIQQVNTQIKALEQSPSAVQTQPNISTPESPPSSQQSPGSPPPASTP